MCQVLSFHLHVSGHVRRLHQLVLSTQACTQTCHFVSRYPVGLAAYARRRPLTIGVPAPRAEGGVTPTRRTSSGSGEADRKGDSGPGNWGDSRVGEGGSELRLQVESVLLWPAVRCVWGGGGEKKDPQRPRWCRSRNSILPKALECVCGRIGGPR